MCIGIPMQVISHESGYALCEGMGEQRRVDTLLVGDQPVGSWLLIFLNSAREVLTESQAVRIRDALQAVNLAMQGEENIAHLFADLLDQEPQLPPHLRDDTP
jgi:hydrogenase expression/formation protein HypC